MSRRTTTRLNSERGQIVIITAFAMIVLMGIAALVVDLGFSWMLRRQEQNAADAAALAAARHIDDATGKFIDQPNAEAAACYYAQQNGFFVDDTGCTAALGSGALQVHFPPQTGPRFVGDIGKVQVIISQPRETFFSAVLGFGDATVATQAIASRERGDNTTNSLHILDPVSCASLLLNGNPYIHIYPAPSVTVDGGHVQVDSRCGHEASSDDQCSNMDGALRIDGTNANFYASKVNVVGGCRTNQPDEPHGVLDEAARPIDDPLRDLDFPAWDTTVDGASCGVGGPATKATGPNSSGCGNNPMNWAAPFCTDDPLTPEDESRIKCVTLAPGVYYGGWKIETNTRVNLQPGIYVIAGGGVVLAGSGTLDSVGASGSPAPVLIFNTDNPVAAAAGVCPLNNDVRCQQDVDVTTNKSLKLAGLDRDAPCEPVTSATATSCPFGGMVLWYDADGSQTAARSGAFIVSGGTQLFISGTIYAPFAKVNLAGDSATNTNTPECPVGATQVAAVQIIAWQLEISGAGDLCMPYDPGLLYKRNDQGLVH